MRAERERAETSGRFAVLRKGRPQARTGMGDQDEHAALMFLPASWLGREALRGLLLVSNPVTT